MACINLSHLADAVGNGHANHDHEDEDYVPDNTYFFLGPCLDNHKLGSVVDVRGSIYVQCQFLICFFTQTDNGNVNFLRINASKVKTVLLKVLIEKIIIDKPIIRFVLISRFVHLVVKCKYRAGRADFRRDDHYVVVYVLLLVQAAEVSLWNVLTFPPELHLFLLRPKTYIFNLTNVLRVFAPRCSSHEPLDSLTIYGPIADSISLCTLV
jgi:hypothetical protein